MSASVVLGVEQWKPYLHFLGPPLVPIRIDVPKDMLDQAKGVKGEMKPELLARHMKLVHYQLLRVRTALAIASMTGRIIVMPPIWCEIDKYWAPLFDGEMYDVICMTYLIT